MTAIHTLDSRLGMRRARTRAVVQVRWSVQRTNVEGAGRELTKEYFRTQPAEVAFPRQVHERRNTSFAVDCEWSPRLF